MNVVCLSGGLGRDAWIHEVAPSGNRQGGAWVKFSLGTKLWSKTEGSTTAWVNCKQWIGRNQVDFYKKNLVKGARLAVQGQITEDNYEKDGKMQYHQVVRISPGGLEVTATAKSVQRKERQELNRGPASDSLGGDNFGSSEGFGEGDEAWG
jgi:single-stranded DNA-binding protein